MPTTWNAIYLGNFSPPLDPTEGNSVSENAAMAIGVTAGGTEDPLFQRIVSVTAVDNSGRSGALDTNLNPGNPDRVQYDLGDGSGPRNEIFDGIAVYDATVTFADGSEGTVTAVIFQDDAGNAFLAPELGNNDDAQLYQSKPIVSLRIDGLVTNQTDLGANRNASDFITCFVAGTMIATPDGPRAVEDLRAGDLVLTVDEGAQPLRWVGARSLDVGMSDNLKPVRIREGALGQGLPEADLMVSPQHRVLVRSAIAQRMFGTDEVLVAAKQLVALPGIEIAQDATEVVYVHLLFDRHQLVTSNGVMSESLFTGPQALKGVSEAARAEIVALFPALAGLGEEMETPHPVRPLIAGRQGRRLAQRHLQNDKSVIGGV
ncbi:Hint domain-containing protein [Paracoccus stylophorae]|uniref:Hint domain-containing protein n=1 Tax=Paracoccus stylophorae TaxID=659350 RepID=A0ABY7SQY4_9RHOB|nr:Hint domain-containing protein [Paracoccus stylophorae]WCR09421.1 Hint domain-containing protein [Paracoccus stylophorae]